MIDIHCHILPGIDDGAKNEKESLAMLRQAVVEGISTIVVSPHHNVSYYPSKRVILQKVSEINRLAQQYQLPIRLLPGQEIRLYGRVLEDYEAGNLLTMTGRSSYLLIEFPTDHVPQYAERIFSQMLDVGLQPILAHPERNVGLLERPQKLYDLVREGTLTQITGASLTGRFGKKIERFAHQLIENNLTHIIASDAHNTTGRAFKTAEAFEVIRRQYGKSLVNRFQMNAQSVVENRQISADKPTKIRERKFLGLF